MSKSGKKVILGLTGSVATVVAPKLALALINAGHDLVVVATEPALFFMSPELLYYDNEGGTHHMWLDKSHSQQIRVWKDKDEWPAGGYHKNDDVQHIKFREENDVLLIAPLTANTLAKIAYGQCDNFLTCIVRAWQKDRPFILAPAMNTVMWEDPITSYQFNLLRSPFFYSTREVEREVMRFSKLTIVEPVEKKLACGDVGKGAMANIGDIVKAVNAA